MDGKVMCKNCKWYGYGTGCWHPDRAVEINYITGDRSHPSCYDFNRSGNCHEYKRKETACVPWYKRIFRHALGG